MADPAGPRPVLGFPDTHVCGSCELSLQLFGGVVVAKRARA